MIKKLLWGFVLTAFLLPTTFTQAQVFRKGKLWKTIGVYDADEKKVKAKFQQFVYTAGPLTLHHLNIDEEMNMETGEVRIEYQKDTFRLSPHPSGNAFSPDGHSNVKIVRHNKDSIRFVYEKYSIAFVPVKRAASSPSMARIKKKTMKKTFEEHREGGGKSGITETFVSEEMKNYKSIGTGEEWSSAFRFITFEDFIFLKGITAAPILVTKAGARKIVGLRLDYRFAPVRVELKRHR